MRTMYDSVTASAIPSGAQLVAGYVDGAYAWPADDWAAWSHVPQVRIAVFPTTNDGNCADVEHGDMSALTVLDWLRLRRAAGADPSVYCGWTDWFAIQGGCIDLGIPFPHHWLADWDGRQALYNGDVAHQWTNGPAYDTSVAADYWPGVDPLPPTPTPGPGGDIVSEQQVRAVIDQYLAADIEQGSSAQALIKALIARIGAAGVALSLDKPIPGA